ncbi:hypothetical protein Tco_0981971 [Tanacetum coccineum]
MSLIRIGGYSDVEHLILVPSEFVEGPCTREQTPLILSWERIPRLDSDVRAEYPLEFPDTVQLETAVSTITQEYLLEFTSKNGISEDLHPELPNRGYRIVDFPEGKIGMYTKFFEFANFRIPISQFLFDILGHYQIHLSQFSGWMSFSKRPGKNTPQCYTKPLDSLKNWNNIFFWVDERVFPTTVAWRTSAPKDSMPLEGTRRYFLGDDVYPIFLHDDGREMDLFNLVSAPNPVVIKIGTRPRTAHEVLLCA